MKRTIATLVVIAGLVWLAFYGQSQLHLFTKPCAQPITYSLGTFDTKFGLSQATFLKDLDKAVAIWETPTGKDLFKYDPKGKLKINLIYDYRQEATDKLKSLGISIEDSQSSYDSIRLSYTSMSADYDKLKQNLDAEIASYNSQKQDYEEQVSYWNQQGGAPKNTVRQLNSQRDALTALGEKIQRDQNTLNDLAKSINAAVDVLNRLAKNLNLTVSDYNTIGTTRGGEFEEGAYVVSGLNRQIDIYEFDTQDKLVRVLAHELGHALGLEHIDSDPNAIMYRLNQGINEKATAADIAAVKQLCGI